MNFFDVDYEKIVKNEARLIKKIKKQAEKLVEAAIPYWHCGDGMGGCVHEIIDKIAEQKELPCLKNHISEKTAKKKDRTIFKKESI